MPDQPLSKRYYMYTGDAIIINNNVLLCYHCLVKLITMKW